MSRKKDESYDEFEFDTDFSVNSVHLDEFRRRKQLQNPTVLPKSQAAGQSSYFGGKFNRHGTYDDNENTFTPDQDNLEDDFTDVSGFLPSELMDEVNLGSFPLNEEKKSSKFWVAIVLLIVGIGAAILIKQMISKNSANSLPEINYPEPVSASEINEYASPSDSTTEDTTPKEETEPTETQPTSPVYETLKLGDKSDDVKKMQLRLKKLGYLNEKGCTGYYSSVTKKIIKLFQYKAGLKVTGIADSKTLEVLYSDDAPTCY